MVACEQPRNDAMSLESVRADLTAFDNIRDHRTASLGDLATSQWLIAACADQGMQANLPEYPFARRTVIHASIMLPDGCEITIQGRDTSAASIIIMTPKNGRWTCTSERGGGFAAWLACMRRFSGDPPRRSGIVDAFIDCLDAAANA